MARGEDDAEEGEESVNFEIVSVEVDRFNGDPVRDKDDPFEGRREIEFKHKKG